MNGDASMGGDGIITGALIENNIIYNNGVRGGLELIVMVSRIHP